jgi:hypothetical protein
MAGEGAFRLGRGNQMGRAENLVVIDPKVFNPDSILTKVFLGVSL